MARLGAFAGFLESLAIVSHRTSAPPLTAELWTFAYVAPVRDCSAVTVERWKGEVVESHEERSRTRGSVL